MSRTTCGREAPEQPAAECPIADSRSSEALAPPPAEARSSTPSAAARLTAKRLTSDRMTSTIKKLQGFDVRAALHTTTTEVDFEGMMAEIDVTRQRVLGVAREHYTRKGSAMGGVDDVSAEQSDVTPRTRAQQARQTRRQRLSRLILVEGSSFFVVWDSLRAVVALYTLVELPLFLAFDWRWYRDDSTFGFVHLALNALALLVSALDVVVVLLSCPSALARKSTTLGEVLDRNLGGGQFGVGRARAVLGLTLRALLAFPFEFVGGGATHAVHALRGVWLSSFVSQYSSFVVHLRLVQMVASIALQLHWVGCLWWILARSEHARVQAEGHGHTSWIDEVEFLMDGTAGTTYELLITHASFMLAGTILQRGMLTRAEYTASSLVMVLGLITAGIIVSDLTMFLQQLNGRRVAYQAKIDSTRSAMSRLGLPEVIRSRILHYYNYLWGKYGSFELDQAWVTELNPVLRSDVHMYLFRHLVRAVPFFANSTSSQLIAATVQELKRELYMAGDIVIVKGSPGRALYFVTAGELSVVVERSPSAAQPHGPAAHGGATQPAGGRRRSSASYLTAFRRKLSAAHGGGSGVVSPRACHQPAAMCDDDGEHAAEQDALGATPDTSTAAAERRMAPTEVGTLGLRAGLALPASGRRARSPSRRSRWVADPSAMPRRSRISWALPQPPPAAPPPGPQYTVVKDLGTGDYFGEISILNDEYRAAAHVIAQTFVDMHALLRRSFDRLRTSFPELEQEVRASIKNTQYGAALEREATRAHRSSAMGSEMEEELLPDAPFGRDPDGLRPRAARSGRPSRASSTELRGSGAHGVLIDGRLDAMQRAIERLAHENASLRDEVRQAVSARAATGAPNGGGHGGVIPAAAVEAAEQQRPRAWDDDYDSRRAAGTMLHSRQ